MSDERFDYLYVWADVLERFAAAWRRGERPRIEEYLRPFRDCDASTVATLLRELQRIELEMGTRLGESPGIDYPQRILEQEEQILDRTPEEEPETTGDEAWQKSARDQAITPLEETPTPIQGRVREGERHDTPQTEREMALDEGPASAIAPRRVLLNKYVVLERLGQGGWGTVWLVERLDLGEKRAFKVVHFQVANRSRAFRTGSIDSGRAEASQCTSRARPRDRGRLLLHRDGIP
jgi:hypothetical protein